jgi:hypothetical protein
MKWIGDRVRWETMKDALDRVAAETGAKLHQFMSTDGPSGVFKVLELCSVESVPDVIQAVFARAFREQFAIFPGMLEEVRAQRRATETEINEVLDEHFIEYQLISGVIVERDSQALHATNTRVVMDLLGAEGRFKKVEESFQNALREVSSRRDSREDQSGPFADAVTDAASAVHEMLRTLGCEGDQLSKLAEAAVSRGLLLPQDKKLVDWLDAERVRKGDVHGAGSASRGDAWQAIHIAGALILRLSKGPRRA